MKLLKERWQLIALVLVGLGLAYAAASLAIDRGSLWFYLATFVLIGMSIRFFTQAVKKQ